MTNDRARTLLSLALDIASSLSLPLLDAIARVAPRGERQAVVNVALAAGVRLGAFDLPSAADALEGQADAEALKDEAIAAAERHLASGENSLAWYSERLDDHERSVVVAYLHAASHCWPVDTERLDGADRVAVRWHRLRAGLHAVDAERLAVAQGWQSEVA